MQKEKLKYSALKIALIVLFTCSLTLICFLSAFAASPTDDELKDALNSGISDNTHCDNTQDINESSSENTSATSPSTSNNQNASDSDASSLSGRQSNNNNNYDSEDNFTNYVSSSNRGALGDKKGCDFLENQVLPDELETKRNKNFASSFSLTDVDGKNYVTSVKQQRPWGTCWAFSIMAASEISILSELGKSADELPIDLSEHHLSWFAKNHIDDPNNPQYGEGTWTNNPSTTPNKTMEGGYPYFGTSVFASGVGPDYEKYCPYRGVIGRVIAKLNGKDTTYESYGAAVAAGADPRYYSDMDDWTLAEKDRFVQAFKLEESSILPSVTPKLNQETKKYEPNFDGINAIKEQLTDGHGVSVVFCADTSNPQSTTRGKNSNRFINTNTWSHYTWDAKAEANHAVCIVGWDDNYAANNFTIEKPAKWDKNQNAIQKLNGMDLLIDKSGQPYYEKEGNKVYLDKDSLLIDQAYRAETGKYRLDNIELENDKEGRPYYPDGTRTKYVQDVNILCEGSPDTTGPQTPDGNGGWLVKNSWGSKSQTFPNKGNWGIDGEGYFWISYYDLSLGYSETFDFALAESDEGFDYSLCYQHDYLANQTSYSSPFYDSNFSDFRSGNIFNIDENTTIKSTSVNTTEPGTTCKFDLYLLNDNPKSPEDGQLLASKTKSFLYGGFHRCDFDEDIYVPQGQKIGIVVTQRVKIKEASGEIKEYQDMPISMGQNEQYLIDKGLKDDYSVAVVNPGESFAMYTKSDSNSKIVADWSDFVKSSDFNVMSKKMFNEKNKRSWYDIDNVPVKVYGSPVSTPTPEPVPDTSLSNASTAAFTYDNTCVNLWIFVAIFASSVCLICKRQGIITTR